MPRDVQSRGYGKRVPGSRRRRVARPPARPIGRAIGGPLGREIQRATPRRGPALQRQQRALRRSPFKIPRTPPARSVVKRAQRKEAAAQRRIVRSYLREPAAPRYPIIPTRTKFSSRQDARQYVSNVRKALESGAKRQQRYVTGRSQSDAYNEAEAYAKAHRGPGIVRFLRGDYEQGAFGDAGRRARGMIGKVPYARGVGSVLEDVANVTGKPGRYIHHALGAPKSTELLFEIAFDPLTYVGGEGAAARGTLAAEKASRAVARAGVDVSRSAKARRLLNEAVRTGDARPYAAHLRHLEQLAKTGKLKGATGTLERRAAVAAQKSGPRLTTAVRGQRVAGRRLWKDTTRESKRLPGSTAAEATGAAHRRALKVARSPGVRVGFGNPLTAKPRYGVNLRMPGDIKVLSPAAVVSKTARARNRADAAAHVRMAVTRAAEPKIRAAQDALRAAQRTGAGPVAEAEAAQHVQEVLSGLETFALRAGKDAEGRGFLVRPQTTAARRTRQAAMRDSWKHSRSLARATRSAATKNFEDALAPLRGSYKGAELADARHRVQLRAAARESVGNDTYHAVLPEKELNLTPVQRSAEHAAQDNLQKVYRQLADQGHDIGFLKGHIEDYAGTRIFPGGTPTDIVEGMVKQGRSGRGFTAGRQYGSAFEVVHRNELARHIEEAYHVPASRAFEVADELHASATTRHLGEQLARRLQRGASVSLDELTPAQLKAVRQWSQAQDTHLGPIFRNPDDARNEGQVLLAGGKDAERRFGTEISDADKEKAIIQDIARNRQLYARAAEVGDTEATHALSVSSGQLHDELASLGNAQVADRRPLYRTKRSGLSQRLVTEYPAVRRALETIHPAMLGVRSKDGRPILIHASGHQDALARYLPHNHEIDLSSYHLPLESAAPQDVARVRSTLIHELAHARTLNEGQALGELHRLREMPRYMKQVHDARRAVERLSPGTEFPPAKQIAEGLRMQAHTAAVGGQEVVDRFAEMRRALIRDSGNRLDEGRAIINSQWSGDQWGLAARGLRRIEEQYRPAIGMFGHDYVVMTESTARFAELIASDPARFERLVGPEAARWFREDILRVQSGAVLEPGEFAHNDILVRDDGTAMIRGKGGETPAPASMADDAPHPHEAGPEDNPADTFREIGRLPDLRAKPRMILDPAEIGYYRATAQARVSSQHALWTSIDKQWGRSKGDLSLTRLGDKVPDEHAIWVDARTGEEYIEPHFPGDPQRDIVGPDRLWPAQTFQDAHAVLTRMGEFEPTIEHGIQAGVAHIMGHVRFGLTVPFPAYHLRNMFSDVLKSLQADTGVMFHPLVNAKMMLAPYERGQAALERLGPLGHLRVPGVAERMAPADFLMWADQFGVRSGEHLAEFAQLAGQGAFARPGPVRAWFARRQRQLINAGAKREDTVRLMTFMQRLKRNGGDAADAAWYSIRHHFDYGDLTAFERRVVRNVFLFYTWYRKNIPLQLMELARRPGFFAAIAQTYEQLPAGGTPINQNWSKLNPLLPDMSQRVVVPKWRPDYITDRLMATPLSWNGHAMFLGYGAPWADLNAVSTQGAQQMLRAGLNPAITIAANLLITPYDALTGRQPHAREATSVAAALEAAGVRLQHDRQGRPTLPWAVTLALSPSFLGRATASLGSTPVGQEHSKLRALAPLTGVNANLFPKPGTPAEAAGKTVQARGLLAEREKFYLKNTNLPKADFKRKMREYDKNVLARTARRRGLLEQLKHTQGWSAGSSSTLYRKKGKRGGAGGGFGSGVSGGSGFGGGSGSSSGFGG